MERWIEAGRLRVNGKAAKLGDRVSDKDTLQLDGRTLKKTAESAIPRVLLYHKPLGEVCSRRDDEGRPTVYDRLPRLTNQRWISVGRLDINTSGLLLMCTDGELANRMMHPSTGLDREYAVRVNGELEDDAQARLLQGVLIDGEKHSFSDIRYFNGSGMNHWYHVVLMEGKNREVRRLFESLGLMVSRLKRVRYGPVLLPSWLPVGQRDELIESDVAALGKLLQVNVGRPARERSARAENSARKQRSVLIEYPGLKLPA